MRLLAMTLFAGIAAAPAMAEYKTIGDVNTFRSVVEGRTLTRPLIKLQVLPGGKITGTGGGAEVSGSWDWKGQYFCRDLNWRGRDLGYNCQTVSINGGKIRFTADQGQGESADFRLR
ncbi:dihydrodipicolinate reductase [Lutimaribacter marinistellae]|uniref:Dihydrodipicolinate reductase n=1 Tax=Lutimaribacter marinistellae TaxID=1820329 RepID=A0ABV7TGG2_9RHOB